MAVSTLNRVTGINMRATVTAQNASGAIITALGTLTQGYLDRVQGTYTPTYLSYTPIGQPEEHDQATSGYWEVTLTGADWELILMKLSSVQEAARKNKNPVPLFRLSLVGYSPDDGTKVINWVFGKGTLRQSTFDVNGLSNPVTADAQIRFRTFDMS